MRRVKMSSHRPLSALAYLLLSALALLPACGEETRERIEGVGKSIREAVSPTPRGTPEALAWLKSVSSELHEKVTRLNLKIEEINLGLQELEKLRRKFPTQKKRVGVTIAKWEEILDKLESARADIIEDVEAAYVEYKIDEVQGRKSLEQVEGKLITRADETLRASGVLRAEMEHILAGRAKITTGSEVMTKKDKTPIKDRDQTLTTVPAETRLTALAVKGAWVKVSVRRNDEPITGWIHKRYLRLGDSP